MQAGIIGQIMRAPEARRLISAAAAAAGDDAVILTQAYFRAAKGGWEQASEVHGWLSRAASLSESGGPLTRASLKDIADQQPAREEHARAIVEQLRAGNLPLWGVAKLLNRKSLELSLEPALANEVQEDVRRRRTIFAYSGERRRDPDIVAASLVLDPFSILTFARLGVLPIVLSSFQQILVPHDTLAWLFREFESVGFHQPSRIADAQELKRQIAAGTIRILPEGVDRDAVLERQVGGELAVLLRTVQAKSKSEDGTGRFVVRPAPVYRLGSFMNEEADLTAFAESLRSCSNVVRLMRVKGALLASEVETAKAFLKLNEKSWPNEPPIEGKVELYVDALALSNFQAVGLLGKLRQAGIAVFITEQQSVEADRLIAAAQMTDAQLGIIDAIRESLADAIRAGAVSVGRMHELANEEEEEADDEDEDASHPTMSAMSLVAHVDAIVVDDRAINRYTNMQTVDGTTSILDSADILAILDREGRISRALYYELLTKLRRCGYQFVPLTGEELTHHVLQAPIDNGVIQETAELRAIREALLQVCITKTLAMPQEAPWLQGQTPRHARSDSYDLGAAHRRRRGSSAFELDCRPSRYPRSVGSGADSGGCQLCSRDLCIAVAAARVDGE